MMFSLEYRNVSGDPAKTYLPVLSQKKDQFYVMREKDIQRLIDLAEEQLEHPFTKEEARESLVTAGIMEEDGSLSKPLAELAQVF